MTTETFFVKTRLLKLAGTPQWVYYCLAALMLVPSVVLLVYLLNGNGPFTVDTYPAYKPLLVLSMVVPTSVLTFTALAKTARHIRQDIRSRPTQERMNLAIKNYWTSIKKDPSE